MLEKKLELVEWIDANFTLTPDADFDPESDYVVATVGWTEERGPWLLIVGEITPDGERSVTRVQKMNVVRRTRLKLKKPKSTES